MKRALVLFAFLMMAVPAAAQFTDTQQKGGPVAIGQAMAQKDDSSKVAIIQAPAVAPSSGGVIQLSAFGWLEPYVDSLVQAIIVAIFGILAKSKYSQWLDQSSRDALETFVKNRASSLIADGAVAIENKSVKVDSAFLARAANEASTAIPDALKRFNLTPENVAQKVIDAIPQNITGAKMISDAHADSNVEPVPVNRSASAAPAAAAS